MPFHVLVLCTGNSARSQIGEALIAVRGAARVSGVVTSRSAGSRPAARVNPYAIETLANHGITWDGGTPKHIDDVANEQFNLVITVCDNAHEACPYFPGAFAQVHWGLPDPADAATPEVARAAFEDTYVSLGARVDALLSLPLETMDAATLTLEAQAIHDAFANANANARDANA